MKDFILVIPARIGSDRLPQKPLIDICGKPMILHTYARALEATSNDNIFVATDSEDIRDVCNEAGANVMMTSKSCATGTDRIAEFSTKIVAKFYINLQGDEPMMDSKNIKRIIKIALAAPTEIINGWTKIKSEKDFFSPSIPKVVLKENGDLMYMSRAPIPGNKIKSFTDSKKQVCIYSFPYEALQFIVNNPKKSSIELIEDIEILRFIELGWNVKMVQLKNDFISVDTMDNLIEVRKRMQNFQSISYKAR